MRARHALQGSKVKRRASDDWVDAADFVCWFEARPLHGSTQGLAPTIKAALAARSGPTKHGRRPRTPEGLDPRYQVNLERTIAALIILNYGDKPSGNSQDHLFQLIADQIETQILPTSAAHGRKRDRLQKDALLGYFHKGLASLLDEWGGSTPQTWKFPDKWMKIPKSVRPSS